MSAGVLAGIMVRGRLDRGLAVRKDFHLLSQPTRYEKNSINCFVRIGGVDGAVAETATFSMY